MKLSHFSQCLGAQAMKNQPISGTHCAPINHSYSSCGGTHSTGSTASVL